MRNLVVAASTLAISAGMAQAGGLDRSYQSVLPIFNDAGTTSLSYGHVAPSITGTDAFGNSYSVGNSYNQLGFSYTDDINESLSFSVIYDQPFGADVLYNNDPTTSTLGGTGADLQSDALSIVSKYQINDRVSVFGGLRLETVKAKVSLNGVAYARAISLAGVAGAAGIPSTLLGAALAGDPTARATIDSAAPGTYAALESAYDTRVAGFSPAGGYNFQMDDDFAVGYTVGAAYEIPEIAFRLAATYHSEIEHSASTDETIFGTASASSVNYVTPQSFNLDFQTGIAANTLLMASYRWTEFEAVDVVPTVLGSDLVNLDNSQRYTLGVGRKFSDAFSGSVTFSYEPEGDGSPVSPLGPTDGSMGITIGGAYTKDNMRISGGINYTKVGDADAGVGPSAVASFTDNHVWAAGLRVEYEF